MTEICVQISEPLERELEESGVDVEEVVKEALVSKLFERQLSQSKSLQRAMFETLAAKSKLTETGARELAEKINSGMWNEIKEKISK